ncbi:MAG: HEAT repeat domain-containing protein [bacterium]
MSYKIADIKLILRDLQKVIKVISLYPEDNPLPQSLRQSFSNRLVELVSIYGPIHLETEKGNIKVDKEIVFQDKSKEDRLAGIFFDTGIKDLIFNEKISPNDIQQILSALKKYENEAERGCDLVELFWNAELEGFKFTTFEDKSLLEFQDYEKAGLGNNNSNDNLEVEDYHEIFKQVEAESDEYSFDDEGWNLFDYSPGESQRLKIKEAAEAMGYEDVKQPESHASNAALIIGSEKLLSDEEKIKIKNILRNDKQFNVHDSNCYLVKEVIFQEVELEPFKESITISEKLIAEFIKEGRLDLASELLSFLKDYEDKLYKEKPFWTERIKETRLTIGSRDRFNDLGLALNNHADVKHDDFFQYLSNFGWESFAAIVDLLSVLEYRHHREALCEYLIKNGEGKADIISRGIYDKRWYVVRNSVMILAHIGDEKSLKYLFESLDHKEKRVRLEIVNSLENVDNLLATELLCKSTLDEDTEISLTALNNLIKRVSIETYDKFSEVIHNPTFFKKENVDHKAHLRAYSVIGGESAVQFLVKLIKPYIIFNKKAKHYAREAAFYALTFNKTEKAERELKKLAENWRTNIKNQAVEALKTRDKILSGGKDD